MNTKLRVLSVIIILLLLPGCYTSPITPVHDDSPIEEVSDTPQNGGRITLASKTEIVLDPLRSRRANEKSPSNLVLDGLVRIDGEGKIKPCLAISWEISSEGRTYTFLLREDVKWHDNELFSSADIISTFDRIMELRKQRPKPGEDPVFQEFDNVESYTASDRNTFIVSLYKPDADFLFDMTQGIQPSPKEILEGEDPEEAEANLQIIGTGPFKVADYTADSVLLQKNEDYFGKKPYIDEIAIKYYPEEYAAKEAFKRLEVDMVSIDPQDWGVFQNIQEAYLLQSPSRYFEFVALNLRNPLFADAKVRQAMLLAVDIT